LLKRPAVFAALMLLAGRPRCWLTFSVAEDSDRPAAPVSGPTTCWLGFGRALGRATRGPALWLLQTFPLVMAVGGFSVWLMFRAVRRIRAAHCDLTRAMVAFEAKPKLALAACSWPLPSFTATHGTNCRRDRAVSRTASASSFRPDVFTSQDPDWVGTNGRSANWRANRGRCRPRGHGLWRVLA
jgi:hypothetical protein